MIHVPPSLPPSLSLSSLSCLTNSAPHILSKSPSVASVSSTHSTVEELLLNDFMLKYSKNLPLKVKVTKGFFGVSEETAINTGMSCDMVM